jgi:hypothetical protein
MVLLLQWVNVIFKSMRIQIKLENSVTTHNFQ